jgi:hypothetical protein
LESPKLPFAKWAHHKKKMIMQDLPSENFNLDCLDFKSQFCNQKTQNKHFDAQPIKSTAH